MFASVLLRMVGRTRETGLVEDCVVLAGGVGVVDEVNPIVDFVGDSVLVVGFSVLLVTITAALTPQIVRRTKIDRMRFIFVLFGRLFFSKPTRTTAMEKVNSVGQTRPAFIAPSSLLAKEPLESGPEAQRLYNAACVTRARFDYRPGASAEGYGLSGTEAQGKVKDGWHTLAGQTASSRSGLEVRLWPAVEFLVFADSYTHETACRVHFSVFSTICSLSFWLSSAIRQA